MDGKPNYVLALPSDEEAVQVIEIVAPSGNEDDALTLGGQLYETFTCDNCHGIEGEGSLESPALNAGVISAEVIIQTVRTDSEDMPAIPERMLPDEQIDTLNLRNTGSPSLSSNSFLTNR